MGNITLSFTDKKQNKVKKKIKLIYHESIPGVKEYYTYIDKDGYESVFNDSSYMISKISSTKTIAKRVNVCKVPLEYVPEMKSVEYEPGYFTYNDNKLYLGKPIYNEETNSYFGVFDKANIYDKEVKLFEEI